MVQELYEPGSKAAEACAFCSVIPEGTDIDVQVEVTLFIITLIVGWIFYLGVKAQFTRVKTGKEALIGSKGIATTDLKPKGEIRVMGEFWEATAKDTSIVAGQSVEVIGINGTFLVVKPAEEKA